MAFYTPWINFILGWTLNFTPLVTILIISLILALLIVLATKLFTKQELMKQLKGEIKTLQKELKELRDDPQKAAHVQKQAMQANLKYMGQSFRPTIITFIPLILIFGWLNGNLAFEPLTVGEEFTMSVELQKGLAGPVEIDVPEGIELTSDAKKELTDGATLFTMRGEEPGKYQVVFDVAGRSYTKDVRIVEEGGRGYEPVRKSIKDKTVRFITIQNPSLKVLGPLSWLWAYIIFSILFTTVLRKVFKVY